MYIGTCENCLGLYDPLPSIDFLANNTTSGKRYDGMFRCDISHRHCLSESHAAPSIVIFSMIMTPHSRSHVDESCNAINVKRNTNVYLFQMICSYLSIKNDVIQGHIDQ